MKKSIFLGLLALSMAFVFSACSNSTSKSSEQEATAAADIYSCPMHPAIQSDEPGDCSVCGMPLVKEEATDTTHMHMHGDSMQME